MHGQGSKRLGTLPGWCLWVWGPGRVGMSLFSMQGSGQPVGKQQILVLTLGPSLLFSPAGPI